MTTTPTFLQLIVLLMSLGAASTAGAHGEDKPGPHGGVIRMPGGFHVEAKAAGKGGIRLYLLDMEWKNPVIGADRPEVARLRGVERTPMACAAKKDHYECLLPPGQKLEDGDELRVKTTRKGVPGIEVGYRIPLKPGSPKPSPSATPHGSHGAHGTHDSH